MIIMVPEGIHIDSIKDKKDIKIINPQDFYHVENGKIVPENWYISFCEITCRVFGNTEIDDSFSARGAVALIPYNKQVLQQFMDMHRTDICVIYPDTSTFDIKTWVDTIDYEKYTGEKNPDIQYINTLKRFLTPTIERDVTELKKIEDLDFFENTCILMHPDYVLSDIIDTFKLEKNYGEQER